MRVRGVSPARIGSGRGRRRGALSSVQCAVLPPWLALGWHVEYLADYPARAAGCSHPARASRSPTERTASRASPARDHPSTPSRQTPEPEPEPIRTEPAARVSHGDRDFDPDREPPAAAMPTTQDRKNAKKKAEKKQVLMDILANPVGKYYDPTETKGIRTYFPPPDYEKLAQAEREVHLREHPPWAYKPISISDPTCRRRMAEAERRVRERLGFTRAEQLSVQRSVGVASLLTGGTSNTGGAKLAEGPSRSTALLAPSDLHAYVAEHADTSLGRDLHRISEELDAVAADASAAAAAAIALAAADAAARQKRKEARQAERDAREARQAAIMPTNEYQGKSARAIAGKLMMESVRNLCLDRSATALGLDQEKEAAMQAAARARRIAVETEEVAETTTTMVEERNISQSLADLKRDIFGIQAKSHEFLEGSRCGRQCLCRDGGSRLGQDTDRDSRTSSTPTRRGRRRSYGAVAGHAAPCRLGRVAVWVARGGAGRHRPCERSSPTSRRRVRSVAPKCHQV